MALVGALALAAAVAASVVASGSARSNADYRVAVVTDIGSLQDRSFNELANKGRIALDAISRATRRVCTRRRRRPTGCPNLIAAAQGGYDLVFGVGFLMFRLARRSRAAVPEHEVRGRRRDDVPAQQAVHELLRDPVRRARGRLPRRLPRRACRWHGRRRATRSAPVGANNVPPILKFMSGYIQGAKRANPKIKVLINFANDPTFSDQAKCKEQALNQIEKGARVVFQVAGGCGLGVHSAAKEQGRLVDRRRRRSVLASARTC